MTPTELALEALLDLITMRHCNYLAQWHDSQLRASIAASGYGNPH